MCIYIYVFPYRTTFHDGHRVIWNKQYLPAYRSKGTDPGA